MICAQPSGRSREHDASLNGTCRRDETGAVVTRQCGGAGLTRTFDTAAAMRGYDPSTVTGASAARADFTVWDLVEVPA